MNDNPITIPPSALEAGAEIIAIADEDTPFGVTAENVFRAMLKAWGGDVAPAGAQWLFFVPHLTLPITEKPDDKA